MFEMNVLILFFFLDLFLYFKNACLHNGQFRSFPQFQISRPLYYFKIVLIYFVNRKYHAERTAAAFCALR